MRFAMTLIAAAITLALALPASAKPIDSAGLTRGEVAAWLKGKGYPVTATKDSNGLSILKSTTPAGVNFDVYFFDCNDAGRCPSIQFAAGWSMTTAVKLDHLNAWNREHRYMRAYVQDSGALYGELDMIIAPAGTMEQLEKNRTLWNTLLAKFKTHFGI
jgi:hypothetical protein